MQDRSPHPEVQLGSPWLLVSVLPQGQRKLATEPAGSVAGLQGHGGDGVVVVRLTDHAAGQTFFDSPSGQFCQSVLIGDGNDHEVVGFISPFTEDGGPLVGELKCCMCALC